jgi:hypothetical protein
MVRHEYVRESSEEGALPCQTAQKPQIGGVIVAWVYTSEYAQRMPSDL